MYLDADERGRAGSVGGASPKHNSKKHWQRNRGSNSRSSNNTELLQRARNHRLQDRRTEHQYEPCSHDGLCDSMGCSCMKRDHMCDKACSCSRECPNRYVCLMSICSQDIKAVDAQKEAAEQMHARVLLHFASVTLISEMTIAMYISGGLRPRQEAAFCCNMHVAESVHKRVGLSFSTIHGWGVFALEDIKCGEFVYEYTGAVVSQDEAERRGSIYDKRSVSFLFDLNEDAVVDAVRKGNKSKFVNHKSVGQNCSAKVVRVRGDHHITVWADQDIKCGEELLFNYGYHGDTAPEWSQVGVAGSSGSDDATCSMKT
uniref:SET domain-containing protein n=1 Tax=Globisporangium ultimum (strain ATCC 200006 / CBS 805.95 / DAOM BR144) TaxID=431595 RepID=K3WMK5_GLOUD